MFEIFHPDLVNPNSSGIVIFWPPSAAGLYFPSIVPVANSNKFVLNNILVTAEPMIADSASPDILIFVDVLRRGDFLERLRAIERSIFRTTINFFWGIIMLEILE